MFLFIRRLIAVIVVGGGYATAAELPDISGAMLTPPAEQFAVVPAAPDTVINASPLSSAEAPPTQTAEATPATEAGDPYASDTLAPQQPAPGSAPSPGAAPESASSPATSPETAAAPDPQQNEEIKQDQAIGAVLQAIRQRQLTPLSTECLSMSFVDNSDDPENYLIDVRENRNHPDCGGDPETSPHLFFFKADKADGTLQTDAGVEPEDFYPLENSEQTAVAALTAEDFTVEVNGTTLTLGQVWNEDIMMSLPPERAQQQNNRPGADPAYHYYQHSYDALTLVASNENWQQRQHSPDDSYLGEITLLNPTLATHRGVHVGMTVDELERKYGPGEADERQGESWLSWQLEDKVFSARISQGLVTLIRLSNLQPAEDTPE